MNLKNVLVTGSSKGIGRSLIEEFAKNNCNVIINYNNSKKEALKLQSEIISKYKVKCLCLKADITNEIEIKEMFKQIIQEFGKLDILINNAAIAIDNPFLDKTKEEFMKVLEVNVVGTFLVTKYASTYVKNIINISSTDAVDTYNELNIDYSASKAAINSLTKSLAMSLPNIRIISVMPSFVNTESVKEMDPVFLREELIRTNQKRLYEPREVAKEIIDIINDKNIKTGSIVRLNND